MARHMEVRKTAIFPGVLCMNETWCLILRIEREPCLKMKPLRSMM